jgi:chromosome segregation ATPase
MARLFVVAALLAGGVSARSDDADALRKKALSVAGVQKVIDMLRDMLASAKKEKNDEEVGFAKFSTWCGGEKSSLTTEIARNGDTISLLGTEIEKLDSDASTLADEIAALEATIASREADIEKGTAERKKEHEDFLAEEADYGETLSALDRAIEVMSKQDYDRPAASAALLQLNEKERLPRKMQSIIAAFVGMMDSDGGKGDYMSYAAPEANAYEFQSGSIIATLKTLKDEFRAKLAQSQKEEMNAQHAFDMIKLDMTDTIENSQKTAAEKTALKEKKLEMSAANSKQKATTEDMKAANEKTLSDLSTECSEKDMSFEEKQNLRTE